MALEWNGAEIAKLVHEAGLDGAEEWAYPVEADAKEGCPVKRGTMRGTHYVKRDETGIEIGCGGPAAPYTVRQHEDASLHHTVGHAHWLEDSFNAHLYGGGIELQNAVARKIEEKLK